MPIKRKGIFLPGTVFLIIVSAFILSIFIRSPYLNHPLTDELGGWLTAHTLRTQQIWYENGALAHQFLPLVTYQHDADRNINNQGHEIDKKGNYYYTSYSPFFCILPYLIFRVFNIYPDVLPLEIFNLAIHFICCLFVYWIISFITKNYYLGKLNLSAFVGMGVYLFAPATLIYHSNVYFADILVQLFFLMGIYFFLRIISDAPMKSDYVLFAIINFLMVYTEWLGVFFSFTVAIYAFFHIKRKGMATVLMTVILTCLSVLILIVWQFSQINGFNNLAHTLLDTYQMRSGLFKTADWNLTYWNIKSWQNLIESYYNNYIPFLVLLFLLGFIYFVSIKEKFSIVLGQDRTYFVALYLCFLPIILHHLVFFNHFVVHDFAKLKDGVLISFSIAFFYHKIFVKGFYENSEYWEWRLYFNVAFILAIICSVNMYSQRSDHVNRYFMRTGNQIALTAKKDDVVFMIANSYDLTPQLVFYAHRNIALWKDDVTAKQLLKLDKSKRGIIFYFNKENSHTVGYTYIYLLNS